MASDLSLDTVRGVRAGCRLYSRWQRGIGSHLKCILPPGSGAVLSGAQPPTRPGRELGGTSLGTNQPADTACRSFLLHERFLLWDTVTNAVKIQRAKP